MRISPTRKNKIYDFPYVIDLVEDISRCNMLFALCALLLFLLVAVQLISNVDQVNYPPLEINPVLPLTNEYFINQKFNEQFPTMRFKVTNQDGIMEGIELQVKIADLLIADDPTKPNCDSVFRSSISDTLDYIRMKDVCQIKLRDFRENTNDFGVAFFENFTLLRGPQGAYTFNYQTSSGINDNYHLKALHLMISKYLSIRKRRKSLLTQQHRPHSQLTLEINSKIPLKLEWQTKAANQCRMQRWQFSAGLSQSSVAANCLIYLSIALRYAWLEGNINKTDSNGETIFTNLTIYGSNSQTSYLFFAVDGLIVQNWGIRQPYFTEFIDKSLYFQSPILLQSPVGSLLFVEDYKNLTVKELDKFTMKIQVLDLKNKPLKDQMVFARIIASNDIYPGGYPPQRLGYANKQLRRPIPGVYSIDSGNPLSQDEIMFPFLSDSNGTIVFDQLSFDTSGEAGSYTILFECVNIQLQSPIISVTTKVNQITFYMDPPSYINTNQLKIEDGFYPIIQMLDDQGNGISGKTPKISYLTIDANGNKNYLNEQDINMRLNTEHPSMNPTSSDGYCKLYFSLGFLSDSKMTMQMEATIDGLVALSKQFTIEAEGDDNQCGTIFFNDQDIIDSNHKISIDTDLMRNYTFKVLNSNSDVMATPQTVYLDSVYISDSMTEFPQGVFNNFKATSKQTSIIDGIATFQDYALKKGTKGHIYMRGMTYSILPLGNTKYKALVVINPGTKQQQAQYFQALQDASDAGFIKICYSQYLRIEITSKVQTLDVFFSFNALCQIDKVFELQNGLDTKKNFQLSVNDTTATTNLFYSQNIYRVQVQTTNAYHNQLKVQTTNAKNQLIPLANTRAIAYFTYMMRPPYQYGGSIANAITIPSKKKVTDDNGLITVDLQIAHGYIGVYTLLFSAGGAFSDVLMFTVYSDISLYSASTTQPLAQNPYQVAGMFLKSGTMQIKYNNQPSPQEMVISSIIRTNATFLDITDIGGGNDQTAVYSYQLRVVPTDSNGLAQFSKLSVVDTTQNNTCVKYQIFIGQNVSSYRSDYSFKADFGTQKYCFNKSKQVTISDKSYSKVISQGANLKSTLKISVTKEKSDYDEEGVVIYAAMPLQINDYYPENPFEFASLYLSNFVCLYNQKKLVQQSICSPTLDIKGNGPYFYQIEFKQLKWIQVPDKVKFRLTIADPLNPIQPTKVGDSVQILSRVDAEFTQYIQVSNTPAFITLTTMPPPVVIVGQNFLLQANVKISTGLPVIRKLVSAFVTIDPLSIDKMLDSQFGTLLNFLATDNNNQLTQLQHIQISQNKAKTNKRGDVSFNLQITAGMETSYTVSLASDPVQSNPSVSFRLVNPIKNIQFEDFPNQFVVAEDSEFSLKLDLKYMNDQVFLGHKDIQLFVYPYVDQKILDFLSKNQTLPIDILLKQYLETPDKYTSNSQVQLSTTINAVLNGGVLSKPVLTYSKDFDQSMSDYEEFANGTVFFKSVKINFAELGDFMLVAIINGIESVPSGKITIVPPDPTIVELIQQSLEIIIILSVVFSVLISSHPQNHFCWSVFGLLVTIAGCGILVISQQGIVWKVMVWILFVLIVICLVVMIYKLVKRIYLNDELVLFVII